MFILKTNDKCVVIHYFSLFGDLFLCDSKTPLKTKNHSPPQEKTKLKDDDSPVKAAKVKKGRKIIESDDESEEENVVVSDNTPATPQSTEKGEGKV